MSKATEDIKKQIHNMSLEDYKKKVPKKSKTHKFKETLKSIFLWRFKVIGAILGIDEKDITSTGKSDVGSTTSAPTHNIHNQEGSFHDRYGGFDPARIYRERLQERGYFSLIDGRGDPEHCDHDER